MKVHFRLGRLGSKPDALTCRWDVYMEGDNPEAIVTNVHLVFTSNQLTEVPVLAHAGSMEDLTPSNTLDQDAHCRWDNGPMCKSPISTGFGPQNITVIMSQESHYWDAFF